MYAGRFAPSPTGPLHFGSLVTALASFLRARQQKGRWLVRIEDIDPPRQPGGAIESILGSLIAHGLDWDGELAFQSKRSSHYDQAIEQLRLCGLVYPCDCSRKQIKEAGSKPGDAGLGAIYPGTCRHSPPLHSDSLALRMRVNNEVIRFDDLLQGPQEQNLSKASGDFLIRRRDGLYSYALAGTVDDILQGITEIIRGADLLSETPRHIYLTRKLGCKVPEYGHVAVALNLAGQKLSKQQGARALDDGRAGENLAAALRFLRLPVEHEVSRLPIKEIIDWAISNFSLDAIKGIESQRVNF
jgi:glutamyl-Q tRNA(Asp) synthetase